MGPSLASQMVSEVTGGGQRKKEHLDHVEQKVLQRPIQAIVAVLHVEPSDVVHNVRKKELAEDFVGAAEEAEEEGEESKRTHDLNPKTR